MGFLNSLPNRLFGETAVASDNSGVGNSDESSTCNREIDRMDYFFSNNYPQTRNSRDAKVHIQFQGVYRE